MHLRFSRFSSVLPLKPIKTTLKVVPELLLDVMEVVLEVLQLLLELLSAWFINNFHLQRE